MFFQDPEKRRQVREFLKGMIRGDRRGQVLSHINFVTQSDHPHEAFVCGFGACILALAITGGQVLPEAAFALMPEIEQEIRDLIQEALAALETDPDSPES